MVAIPNILLAVVAGALVVEGGFIPAIVAVAASHKRGLEIRGQNNIWARSKFPILIFALGKPPDEYLQAILPSTRPSKAVRLP
jgi:hypothetical protein